METLTADVVEEPHAYAHSPKRASRAPDPARQPARLPVAVALVLECFRVCILYTMFSTFAEISCRQVAAHAAALAGTVPWARMPQPPPPPCRTGTPPYNVRISRSPLLTQQPSGRGACNKRAPRAIARQDPDVTGAARHVADRAGQNEEGRTYMVRAGPRTVSKSLHISPIRRPLNASGT